MCKAELKELKQQQAERRRREREAATEVKEVTIRDSRSL
jgi:hypothetical protein